MRLEFEYFQTFPSLVWKNKFYYTDFYCFAPGLQNRISYASVGKFYPGKDFVQTKFFSPVSRLISWYGKSIGYSLFFVFKFWRDVQSHVIFRISLILYFYVFMYKIQFHPRSSIRSLNSMDNFRKLYSHFSESTSSSTSYSRWVKIGFDYVNPLLCFVYIYIYIIKKSMYFRQKDAHFLLH